MRENNRGCRYNHTFVGEWGTRPGDYCRAAKAKALSCLDQEDPKLTALERAFWVRLRGKAEPVERAKREKLRGVATCADQQQT